MNRSSFVHLHNHTHGSVLDGLQTPSELVAAAVADGQPAVAVTDHGALTETLEVAKAAQAAGVRPLLGTEAYFALGDEPDARCHQHTIHVESDDTEAGDGGSKRSKKKSYEHLTIIAANTDGWRSLCRHADVANSTGKFYTGDDGKAKKHLHGRIDFETIERYHDGLIFLTGCLGGPVAGRLQRGDDAGADRWLARLVGIVGSENVLVEVMDHGNPEQRKIIPGLVALARKYGLRMVATNDSHYSHDSEYGAHDAWLAAQTGRSLADPHRFGRWFPHHSVRSAAAMRGMFDEQPGTEQACNNTLWVAERVEDTIIPFAAPTVPPFPTPPGFKSSLDYFKHLIREGAAERYGTPLPPVVQERINFECKILKEKGFIDYFLVEHELVAWERSQGGRIGPGRGSAAGCAVAYCLGITNVDPIRWGLLFERFMHPERTSMPDIDTDFEPHRREAIFEHLADFWGKDRFARIGTVGTVKARAAIVRAAKVLDAPSGYDRKLANAVPPNIFGRSVTIAEALADGMAQGADLRRIRDEEPFAAEVLELAEKFENRIASEGIHACGVVIGDRPLADFLPLRYTDDGTAISQYIDKGVEALGLVKYDVLGLINLTVISAAVRKLIDDGTVGADIDRLPWEGSEAEKVFSMIAAGDTIGVFQLGNSGMRDLCRRLIPRAPEDLFALLALYRPGPMASGLHNAYADRRNGREEVSYDALTSDPAEIAVLEPILGPTYGVLVFQEQILKLAQQVAGWSPGDSDDLRSAVGKKLRDKMADLKARFVADLQTPRPGFAGLTAGTAERLWGWIEANADYSFNLSHTVGYGHVAWQTAWLKCHHPVEYAAALLTYEEDSATRLELFADMADHSIPVLLPDVNASGVAPSPAEGSVRLGLGDIAGLGETAAEIVAERDANGPYRSAAEIVTRCSSSVNTRTVENLIRSGACDAFGSRLGQIQVLAAATKSAVPIPAFAGEWSPMQRLHHERLALGLYISGHPVLTVKDQLRGHVSTVAARFSRTVKASDLANLSGGAPVAVWGVVSGYVEKLSKRGNRFAKFVLDAPSGQVEVIAFSGPLEAMARRGIRLASTQIVKVCGDLEFPDVYRTDDDVSEASEAKPQIVLRDAEVFVPVEPARLRLVSAVAEPTPTVAAFRLAAPETPDPVPVQPPAHEPVPEPVDAAGADPVAETEADVEAEMPVPAAEDAAEVEVVAPAEEVTTVEEVAPIEAAEPAAKTAPEPAATSVDNKERAGRNSVISLHGSLAQMGRKLQMAG